MIGRGEGRKGDWRRRREKWVGVGGGRKAWGFSWGTRMGVGGGEMSRKRGEEMR